MDERNGYSKRIYRQEKKSYRLVYYIIALVVVIGTTGFFIFLNKESGTPLSPGKAGKTGFKKQQAATKGANPKEITTGDAGADTKANMNADKEKESLIPQPEKKSIKPLEEPAVPELKDRWQGSFDLLVRATRHFMSREYEKALPLYKELAALDNRLVFYIGICYYTMEDYANARDYLEKALTQDRKDNITMKFLAFTFYKLNELEKSLDYAEAALEIDKNNDLLALKSLLEREIKAMDGYGHSKRVNFNVVFSKFEHSRAKQLVIEYLEEAYRSIGRRFDFYPANPITVILYNEKNFFDVTRSPSWAGGLYDGKIRLPIGGIEGYRAELRRILFHEYTHALVHALIRPHRCPTWLNEGLAEYFSNKHGNTIGQIIPLAAMEKGFPSGDPNMAYLAYLESYSAVSYLVDRYKLYSIKEFLQAMGKGEDLETAFSAKFFISYDQFLKTWGKD